MNEKAPVTELRVNLSPVAKHHRQMRWQVWVPLIASIILILGLAVLTIVGAAGGSTGVARWANISAIWIILPILLVGFFFLIITAALVYGMAKLLNHMPDWMLRVQLFMERISLAVRQVSDTVTKPVMAVNGFQARVAAFWRKIRGKTNHAPQAGEKIYS